jgi:hypothetical protein
MNKLENRIEIVRQRITEILVGASFDKFSYAGIYSMEFTLKNSTNSFNSVSLDIATEIVVGPAPKGLKSTEFAIADFYRIWGKTVSKVDIEKNLSLILFFDGDILCTVSSALDDPEGLFDLRWTIRSTKESDTFSIWVSSEKDIFLRE